MFFSLLTRVKEASGYLDFREYIAGVFIRKSPSAVVEKITTVWGAIISRSFLTGFERREKKTYVFTKSVVIFLLKTFMVSQNLPKYKI